MSERKFVDYVWTDGHHEDRFCGEDAFKRAQIIRELRGQGKVWRRVFVNGLLEEVSDATDWPIDKTVPR